MKNGKSRSKWTKSRGYSLTFLLFFAPLWKMENVAENGRKVKAIALFIAFFLPFMKNGKSR
jgi:hypothetical protein